MKRFIVLSLMALFVVTFQECNNPEKTDAKGKESAENTMETMGRDSINADTEFMVKAANGGMMEVEAGKLAQQKGASSAVKEFGAKMAADHSRAHGELQALAATKNITLPVIPGEEVRTHLAEMSSIEGVQFYKHYMDMMVNDHDLIVEMFEEAARDARDADLRTWVTSIIPILKEHQTAAKTVKGKLKPQ